MRPLLRAAVAAIGIVTSGGAALAQGDTSPPAQAVAHAVARPVHPAYALSARRIAADTYVFEGVNDDFRRDNGCNIINTGFVVTATGVVVINTGPSLAYGRAQRAAIARVTTAPVRAVLNLNLHPDYFFGNQAYAGLPLRALPAAIAGMRAEGKAYADNLYRVCGDVMRDTEPMPATEAVAPGMLAPADDAHALELIALSGHTAADLVVLDRRTGVLFAGGLVFAQRVPTTPHADLPRWLASLDRIAALVASARVKVLVPSHGPVDGGLAGIAQTRDYLRWFDAHLRDAAARGLDINELLALPVAPWLRGLAAWSTEYPRSVAQFYPRYERDALTGGR